MRVDALGAAILAGEGEEIAAPHVEAGEEGGEGPYGVDQRPKESQVGSGVSQGQEAERARVKRLAEDLVLREEPRDGEDAGDGDGGDEERHPRGGHVPAHSAHALDVLLAVQPVDHRPGAEEEAGLEEGMGNEVQGAGKKCADADADEHEPELRHRGVGEHFLDVVLRRRDQRGPDGGEHTDDRDHGHDPRRRHVEVAEPRDHVHAGRHHRGGVDQRRDRRWTSHRVREPDVEGKLRALSRRADEQAEGRDRRHTERQRRGIHLRESDAADLVEEDEDPDQEPEIPDPVDDERLAPRVGLLLVGEPEPDQQVAAEAHALPADEHRDQVVAEDQGEHRGDEQVQIREVAPIPGILVHVPDGVDVDEESDAGHHQGQRSGQPVERERHVHA